MPRSLSDRAGDGRLPGRLSPGLALLAVGGAVALSGLIGRRYSPTPDHPRTRDWYERLDKPAFTPPKPVFGLVWPVIETFLALGGYRLLTAPRSPERDRALALLAFNLAMIAGWPKIFFEEHNLEGSLGAILAHLASSVGYIEQARHVDGVAALSGLPLSAWIAFATVLDAEIVRRN